MSDLDWTAGASCLGEDPDIWFPIERRGRPNPDPDSGYGPARAICRGCDVSRECLTYALRFNIDHGMWGGLTPRERRRIRRSRAA